jgi:hypothetical protein
MYSSTIVITICVRIPAGTGVAVPSRSAPVAR